MDNNQSWQRVLVLAAVLAAAAWMEMPQWQRQLILRVARRRAYRLLHRLARASGHRAMGDELHGRAREADAGYAFTERLSRARDAL